MSAEALLLRRPTDDPVNMPPAQMPLTVIEQPDGFFDIEFGKGFETDRIKGRKVVNALAETIERVLEGSDKQEKPLSYDSPTPTVDFNFEPGSPVTRPKWLNPAINNDAVTYDPDKNRLNFGDNTQAKEAYTKLTSTKRNAARSYLISNQILNDASEGIRSEQEVRILKVVEGMLDEQIDVMGIFSKMRKVRFAYLNGASAADNRFFAALDEHFTSIEAPLGKMFSAERAAEMQPDLVNNFIMPVYAKFDSVPVFPREGSTMLKGRIWVDYFMERVFREVVPEAGQFLYENLYLKRIDRATLLTILGLQGAGKGSLLSTMGKLAREFIQDPDKAEPSFAGGETVFSEAMNTILSESVQERVDTIVTGTGGIFNPKGTPRYKAHSEGFKKAAGIPVAEGVLVNDETVIAMTAYEISKTAITATEGRPLVIQGETFPRSEAQADYYMKALPQLVEERSEGKIKFETKVLHLEMVNEQGKSLLEQNRELAAVIGERLGKQLEALAKGGLGDFKDVSARMQGFSEDMRGQIGEEMLSELRTKLDEIVRPKIKELVAGLQDEELSTRILLTLFGGMSESLLRMAGRFKKEKRDDESRPTSVLNRFGDYFKNSFTFVMRRGIEIVPAIGTPEEAIEAMLRAKLRQADPDYDFAAAEFGIVLAKAQQIHRETVYGKIEMKTESPTSEP